MTLPKKSPIAHVLEALQDPKLVRNSRRRMTPPVADAFKLLLDGVETVAEVARHQEVSWNTANRRVDACRRAIYAALRWRRHNTPEARAANEKRKQEEVQARAALRQARKQEAARARQEELDRRRLARSPDTGARARLFYFGRCRRKTAALAADNDFYQWVLKEPVERAWCFRMLDEIARQARERMDGPPPPAPTTCSTEWKRAKEKE